MCARLHSLCIDGDYLVNKISHSREPVFADRGSRGSFFCAAKYGHIIYEYEALRKKSRCPDQIADAPSKTFSPIVQKVVSSKMAISRRICSALIRQLWTATSRLWVSLHHPHSVPDHEPAGGLLVYFPAQNSDS